MCTDVIFTIFNIALTKIEPLVERLGNEVNALAVDAGKRKGSERLEVMNRTFNAKQDTIDCMQEIQNKTEFLTKMNEFNSRSVVSLNEVPFKIKFLTQRLFV